MSLTKYNLKGQLLEHRKSNQRRKDPCHKSGRLRKWLITKIKIYECFGFYNSRNDWHWICWWKFGIVFCIFLFFRPIPQKQEPYAKCWMLIKLEIISNKNKLADMDVIKMSHFIFGHARKLFKLDFEKKKFRQKWIFLEFFLIFLEFFGKKWSKMGQKWRAQSKHHFIFFKILSGFQKCPSFSCRPGGTTRKSRFCEPRWNQNRVFC